MANTSTTADAVMALVEARLARIYAKKPLNQQSLDLLNAADKSEGTPFLYSSQGLVAEATVYDGAFTVDLVVAVNSSGGKLYFQFFDKKNPVAGDVPVIPFPVDAGEALSWSPSQKGRVFPNACSFGISSTCATYTPAAAVFWVDIEGYIS
jgi:hypothetical protein